MTQITEARHGTQTVRLFGVENSPEAYLIRDFLSRSVVRYEWVGLKSAEEYAEFFGEPVTSDIRLPVVEIPGGTRLFAPSLREIAEALGFVAQPKLKEYDLSIYGAGPAGLSAAVYAASEGIRTVLIERAAVGGQAGSSSLIENYLGFPTGISGADLAERARQQAVKFGCEIIQLREGIRAEFRDSRIWVSLADGGQMTARANICATGVEYQRLDLPGEDRFLGAGLYYGAGVSEAAMVAGNDIYIVGGANSAGQAAMHLAAHGCRVTMLVRGNRLADTMSDYLTDRIAEAPNIEVRLGTHIAELAGDRCLEAITVQDKEKGIEEQIEASHVFVCIGGKPNTEWAAKTRIVRDSAGYLVTGPDLLKEEFASDVWPLKRPPYHLETSVPGSFAAGDVRHGSVKRFATAVGEGAMAVTFIHRYLSETA